MSDSNYYHQSPQQYPAAPTGSTAPRAAASNSVYQSSNPYAAQPQPQPQPQPHQQQQFPPPPPKYNPQDYANDPHPTGHTHHFHQQQPAHTRPADSPEPDPGNQIAPYEAEKAYANYYEAYPQQPPQQQYAPAPSGPGYDEPGYSDGAPVKTKKHRYRRNDRERYKSDDGDDTGDEERRLRVKMRPKFDPEFTDKEKGLGASVLGGAGGALIGNKMGGGALGTIGGIVLGAIGGNALEERHEKHKEDRKARRKLHDEAYDHGSQYGSTSTDSYPPDLSRSARHQKSRAAARRDLSDSEESDDSEYKDRLRREQRRY